MTTPLPPGFELVGSTPRAPPLPEGFELARDTVPVAAPPAKVSQGGYNARNYKGTLWPISYDEKGKPSFDSNAGLIGDIKDKLSMFGEAAAGQFDATDPANMDRVRGGAMLLSPVGAATRAGGTAIPAMVRPKVPSSERLIETGANQYKASREMGVDVAAPPIADWARTTIRALEHDERIARAAPETHKILNQLANPPDGAFHTVQTIGGMQRALKEIAGKTNDRGGPTVDAGAATKALAELNGFVSKLPEEAVLAGPASRAFSLRKDADANYAAGKRSEDITGRVERADIRAGAVNSGQNVGNTIRQRMADILTRKGQDRGYTEAELSTIEGLVKGGAAENTLRNVGGALGGSGGLAASPHVLAGGAAALATGNPLMLGISALPLAGMGMKSGAEAITRSKVGKLDQATRERSPLYQNSPNVPSTSAVSPEARTALIRSMLLEQQNAANQNDPRFQRVIDALMGQ